MGETLSQLGHLLVQTIPTIILVLFLIYFLERQFFKPLTQKLEEREAATTGALERARQLAVETEEKVRRYEELLRKARLDNYQVREAARKQVLQEQEEALRAARQQADAFLKEARAGIALETEKATAEIRAALQPLVREISDLALSGPAPSGSEGGERA